MTLRSRIFPPGSSCGKSKYRGGLCLLSSRTNASHLRLQLHTRTKVVGIGTKHMLHKTIASGAYEGINLNMYAGTDGGGHA